MTRSSLDTGVSPSLTADDLLASVPGLAELDLGIAARTFRTLPGASLGFDDLYELAALIESLAADGVAGVVVTQGTDTLEETAFFLDITVAAEIPVVITGAMRNPTLAGADGPANVLAAIAVAASVAARKLGCVVVMSDEIHAARYVRKVHSTSTAAFATPNAGPIGLVAENRPRLLLRPPARLVLPMASGSSPTVPVVPASLGDDFAVLRPRRDDIDGLVVAAFGVGHVPASAVDLLADYAAGVPVVLATRTGAGVVHRASYGFAGSESDLQDRGLINAGILDAYKARVLLIRLLSIGADRAEIARTFDGLG
ncbi:MAG: asparaginase [Actinophytocola sp.]|nr:asparaginase [Actinophytocola sp.]